MITWGRRQASILPAKSILWATLGSGGAVKTTAKDTHDGKYIEEIYEESVEEKYKKFRDARARLRGQIEDQFFDRYAPEKAEAQEVVARVERDIPRLDWEKIEAKLFEFALEDKKRKMLAQEEEFIIMELLN